MICPRFRSCSVTKEDQSSVTGCRQTWIWILLFLVLLSGNSPEAAEVGPFQGVVQRLDLRQNKWISIRNGEKISEGDRIRTGKNGRIELVFKDRRYLRLARVSEIHILEEKENTKLRDLDVTLVRGTIWASMLRKHSRRSRLRIRTPVAVIAVKGTQFNTEFEHQQQMLQVTVLKGRIEVLAPETVKGPEKMRGPKEIQGPREISREEWLVRVSSGQFLNIGPNDAQPKLGTAGQGLLENEWVRFNKERDSSIESQ